MDHRALRRAVAEFEAVYAGWLEEGTIAAAEARVDRWVGADASRRQIHLASFAEGMEPPEGALEAICRLDGGRWPATFACGVRDIWPLTGTGPGRRRGGVHDLVPFLDRIAIQARMVDSAARMLADVDGPTKRPDHTRFVVCSLGVRLAAVSAYSGTRPWAAWFS